MDGNKTQAHIGLPVLGCEPLILAMFTILFRLKGGRVCGTQLYTQHAVEALWAYLQTD